jgi:hypothetical protein
MKEAKLKVKTIERGWRGHFICADRCLFSRNTLIEYDRKKIVVSTVGLLHRFDKVDPNVMIFEPLSGIEGSGRCRWFETMIFEARRHDGKYWDADVQKQISFEGKWEICADSFEKLPAYSDLIANEMHDKIVKVFFKKIKQM